MPFIIPNVFKAGEKAIAEQINENFNYLKESIDQINTTLGSRIDEANDTLSADIENTNTNLDSLKESLELDETVVNLGNINPPEALEDGQVPTAQIELEADRIHTAKILANSEIILPTLEDDTKMVNCLIEFSLNTDCTLTLPSNIKWPLGEAPELVIDGVAINRMIFDTTDGGQNWHGFLSVLNSLEEA